VSVWKDIPESRYGKWRDMKNVGQTKSNLVGGKTYVKSMMLEINPIGLININWVLELDIR